MTNSESDWVTHWATNWLNQTSTVSVYDYHYDWVSECDSLNSSLNQSQRRATSDSSSDSDWLSQWLNEWMTVTMGVTHRVVIYWVINCFPCVDWQWRRLVVTDSDTHTHTDWLSHCQPPITHWVSEPVAVQCASATVTHFTGWLK